MTFSKQIIRFGIIGVLAAAVQFIMVALLVEFTGLKPLPANCIAFLVAFQVSFWGHNRWTFAAHQAHYARRKFFLVASLGFVLNQGLYAYLLAYHPIHYLINLIIVIAVVPLVTFTLSKFWAFKTHETDSIMRR